MKNKLRLSFTFLAIISMLCACNNSNNTISENTTESEIATSYASESKESAFVKDDIMYIRESDGSCYTYNDGIYTDDVTDESYIYSNSYYDLYAVDPNAAEFQSMNLKDSDLSEIGKLDDKNTTGKGVKIELYKMKYDSQTSNYYFDEDWVGRKEYYPENGIWGSDGDFYIFSKNGTRISFSSIEEITE